LVWESGDKLVKEFPVTIHNDHKLEDNETVLLKLEEPFRIRRWAMTTNAFDELMLDMVSNQPDEVDPYWVQNFPIEGGGGGGGGGAGPPGGGTGGAGGKGIVILRSSQYLSTDSACAPVSSPDGGTGTFIAKFKASANVTMSGVPSISLDYLVVAGGASGGNGGNGGGGGGAGGYRTSFPGGTKVFLDSGDNITVGAGGTPTATTPASAGYIAGQGEDITEVIVPTVISSPCPAI
jgi:hypothetical protein